MPTPARIKRPAPPAPAPAAPETAATWVPIDALTPWADNPRRNDGAPVDKVAASIERFGFAAPIVARGNGEIIAGHTRWKAAKKLGLLHVPVRYMDLDRADARLLALADNRLAEEAAWDDALLAAVLAQLKAEGASLAATGFDTAELEALLNGPPPPPESGPGPDDGPTEVCPACGRGGPRKGQKG